MSLPVNPREFHLPDYMIRFDPNFPPSPFQFRFFHDDAFKGTIKQMEVLYQEKPVAEICVRNDEDSPIWEVHFTIGIPKIRKALERIFQEYPKHSLHGQITGFRDHRERIVSFLKLAGA